MWGREKLENCSLQKGKKQLRHSLLIVFAYYPHFIFKVQFHVDQRSQMKTVTVTFQTAQLNPAASFRNSDCSLWNRLLAYFRPSPLSLSLNLTQPQITFTMTHSHLFVLRWALSTPFFPTITGFFPLITVLCWSATCFLPLLSLKTRIGSLIRLLRVNALHQIPMYCRSFELEIPSNQLSNTIVSCKFTSVLYAS